MPAYALAIDQSVVLGWEGQKIRRIEWISLLLVSLTVHDKVDDDDDALGLVVVWAIWPLQDRVYHGYRSKLA